MSLGWNWSPFQPDLLYNWEVWGSTPSGVGLVEGPSIVCAAVGAINASPEQRAGHSIPATNHGPETRVVVSPYTR